MSASDTAPSPDLTKLRVALDWTPNANHVGLYLARDRGLFLEAGLDVELIDPAQDDYATTPGRKVAAGQADFCLAPSESALSFHTANVDVPRLRAVATILQDSTSAISVLESSDIQSPRQLDGRTYASYNGRFEMDVVRAMIRADGGQGTVKELQPPKLDIWSGIVDGKWDATWIFTHHEGVLAKKAGVGLRNFQLEDYGVPYGHSPILLAHPSWLEGEKNEAATRAFLKACAKGYELAAADPKAAAACLPVPELDRQHTEDSVCALAPHILGTPPKPWGYMDASLWEGFVAFVQQQQQANDGKFKSRDGHTFDAIDADKLFTNAFLP